MNLMCLFIKKKKIQLTQLSKAQVASHRMSQSVPPRAKVRFDGTLISPEKTMAGPLGEPIFVMGIIWWFNDV